MPVQWELYRKLLGPTGQNYARQDNRCKFGLHVGSNRGSDGTDGSLGLCTGLVAPVGAAPCC